MTRSGAAPSALGAVLVGLQFALLAWLAVKAAAGLGAARLPADALAAAAAAIALGLWALAANRPGNFNIQPVPREGSMPFRVERNNLIWRRARVRTDEPADA